MDDLENKIIKQVEYYFSDVNISRDKFMKDTISENDGWISYETMLKFNRLKALSEDISFIRKSLSHSTSGLLELGENGIRRNPDLSIPESVDEVFEKCKDRSLYVKGFSSDSTLDEIIEWLETVGGKTMNVHMRRYPDTKKFKGSIFVIFEKKEYADKFLTAPESEKFKDLDIIRQYREDYLQGKQAERDAKTKLRAAKDAAAEENQRKHVTSRMVSGTILELSGLPDANIDKKLPPSADADALSEPVNAEEQQKTTECPDEVQGGNTASKEDDDRPAGLTVGALKQWLLDNLGTDYPVAWIDVEPAEGRAFVRFKLAETAEPAWNKLVTVFGDKPVVYANSELKGRVLSGDEEFSHWKTIVAAQYQKAQKRRGPRGGGRGGGGMYKRRRMN